MRFIYIIIFLSVLTSCTQYKKVVYLQSSDSNDSLKVASLEQYVLKPGDLLYIRIYSSDATSNQLFNFESGQVRTNYNDVALYLNGFQLDDQSNIELPIIGKINLVGNTFVQASSVISDSVKAYLNDVTVSVKLLSYRVTVLGEIRSPGVVTVYRDRSTIFDVLSMVGDIDFWGNRNEVIVLREDGGQKKRIEIDLTDVNVLQSSAYYIYPNDVIYVKPLKARIFRDNIPVISLTLSAVTTFLLILNYFQ